MGLNKIQITVQSWKKILARQSDTNSHPAEVGVVSGLDSEEFHPPKGVGLVGPLTS